jgi:hypothetical protein
MKLRLKRGHAEEGWIEGGGGKLGVAAADATRCGGCERFELPFGRPWQEGEFEAVHDDDRKTVTTTSPR